MKGRLYIGLEGVDGTGKSTLFRNLVNLLEQEGVSYDTLCPTKIVNRKSLPERVYHSNAIFKRINVFRYLIFAYRSYKATKRVNWSVDLVIGDRCVVVSYVKRWRRYFGSRLLTTLMVNIMEPVIPAPDCILLLNAPMPVIQNRLSHKESLEVDESPESLLSMKVAYEEIRSSYRISRISNVKWIDIDSTTPPEELAQSTFQLVLSLLREPERF